MLHLSPVVAAAGGSPLVLWGGLVLVFAGIGALVWSVVAGGASRPVIDLDGSRAKGTYNADKGPGGLQGFAERAYAFAEHLMAEKPSGRRVENALENAGLALRPGEFVVFAALAGAGLGFLVSTQLGPVVGLAMAGLGSMVLPRVYLDRKATKRSSMFTDQLADTLMLLSSSMRGGQGLTGAIDAVAREGEWPTADEFRRVMVEVRLGRDLIEALRAMADRVGSEDFNWVIPAIQINREVGGDLAEVLDTIANTVRDRVDIRRQVKTLSAEGRLSAYVLLALPIGIAGMVQMSNPAYISELTHGIGLLVAGAGVLLMTIGGFWLFKLCKIEM